MLFLFASCDGTIQEQEAVLSKEELTQIAANVFKAFDGEKLSADLLLAGNDDSMISDGYGESGNGMILTIENYKDLSSELLSAKLAQILGNTDEYPMDYVVSLSVELSDGYSNGFSEESFALTGTLLFDLSGIIRCDDVMFAGDKYSVSSSGALTVTVDNNDYEVAFNELKGGMNFVANIKTDLSLDVSLDSLTLPENSDTIITIDGVDISYSDICGLIRTEEV